ncbi:MAG: oligosaccharide flippase family protein [Moraxellaceae bacterium]
MQRLFLKGLGITLLLNLLVKPATIFLVDIRMQNVLGANDYGVFQVMLDFTFLFSMILDMGMTNFMTRLIAQYPHMIQKYSNRLFTMRLVLVVAYCFLSLSLFALLQFIVPTKISMDWLWILLVLIIHQINIISVNYVRAYTGGLLKFGLDALLSVIERSVYFVLGCLLLYGHFIEPITLPLFITVFVTSSSLSLVAAIIIYVRLVAFPKLHWNTVFFRSIFRQSYPYAILVILMMLTIRMSTVLLGSLSPDDQVQQQVAYYVQSFRLLDACWMFGVLFGSILLPVFSRVLKEKTSTTGIMTSALNLLVAGGLLMIAFTVGLKEIIFNMLYKEVSYFSYNSWIFLSMTFVPMCFTIVFGTLLTANKSMRKLNQIALLGLITMIVLNFLLVPSLGAVGSAIALFSSQLTIGVLQYWEVRYNMKHRLARFTWIKLALLSAGLGSVLFIELTTVISPLTFILLLGAVWIILVFGLKIIDIQSMLVLIAKKDSPEKIQ